MTAIIFAIISYFTWGAGVFTEAIVARRLNSYSLVFWSFLLSFVLASFYAPFAIKDLVNLTVGLLIFNIFLGFVALFFGTLFYYEALKIENRALVGTIASSFPMVTVVLSIFFLGERLSNQQILPIILIFIGLFLSILNLDEIRIKKISISKGFVFAVITMLMWGMYFAFIKILVNKIGWFWPNYISVLLFPFVFLYLKIKGKKLQRPTLNNAFIPLVASTILVRTAEFSYNLGISKGLVAVVASIAGANPTFFVFLAFLFFKDPIKRQQIVGIIVTLVGIILLSMSSS